MCSCYLTHTVSAQYDSKRYGCKTESFSSKTARCKFIKLFLITYYVQVAMYDQFLFECFLFRPYSSIASVRAVASFSDLYLVVGKG